MENNTLEEIDRENKKEKLKKKLLPRFYRVAQKLVRLANEANLTEKASRSLVKSGMEYYGRYEKHRKTISLAKQAIREGKFEQEP
ncbi:MAG: hypothetical protein FWE31_01585 [Firmicutes bacterium]|nr:hypothetical protein [Bacillota bacterium]